jgi:hypothetical protein
MMGILLVVQLFPNGRPVGPRWRLVIWATVIVWVVVLAVGHLLTPHRIVDIWSDQLSHAGASMRNPFGWAAFEGVGHLAGSLGIALAIASWPRSTGHGHRQRTRPRNHRDGTCPDLVATQVRLERQGCLRERPLLDDG